MPKLLNEASVNRNAIQSGRYSSLDFLVVSCWMGLVVICLSIPTSPFFAFSVYGGALLVIQHLYLVVFKGGADEHRLQVALGIPVFLLLSAFVHRWVAVLTPSTYDAWLLRWDFGVAATVRAWSSAISWRAYSLSWCYEGLPAAFLLVLVFTRGISFRRLVVSSALAGLLAVPCYLLFPAVGPVHIGDLHSPRNCMPSLHLTWALLLWVNSNRWIRLAALAFALIIALASLTTGEHYTLDLLIALPFTWGVMVLAERIADRMER